VDLKRGGVQVPIIGSQSLGRDLFQSLFADLPEEKRSPGHFAEGVYAHIIAHAIDWRGM